MPVAITNVKNQQSLEVVVSGPGTVTRMFIVSGIGETNLSQAPGGQPHKEMYTVLVGPVLTSAEFVRAIATASPAATGFSSVASYASSHWRIENVDADFDDESGQVRLSIEAEVQAGSQTSPIIETVSFQATILAAL